MMYHYFFSNNETARIRQQRVAKNHNMILFFRIIAKGEFNLIILTKVLLCCAKFKRIKKIYHSYFHIRLQAVTINLTTISIYLVHCALLNLNHNSQFNFFLTKSLRVDQKITKQNSNKNAVESICIKLIRYWSQCNLTLQVIENSWSIVISDNLVFKEFTIFSLKIIILISKLGILIENHRQE